MDDNVVISCHTGQYLIIGYIPVQYRIDGEDTLRLIETNDSSNHTVDTGDFSLYNNKFTHRNPAAPLDRTGGDHITTSEGGSILGVLRGGSILAKASALAQVFVTRFDDLVRIIGRNLEIFTDNRTDVSANLYNRQYRFIGYSDTLKNTREDRYKHVQVYGDTSAGDYLKGRYRNATKEEIPVADTTIRLEYTAEFSAESSNGYNDAYEHVYYTKYDLEGSIERGVRDPDGVNEAILNHTRISFNHDVHNDTESSYAFQDAGEHTHRVDGPSTYNDWYQSASETILDWNGQAVITKNENGIVVNWKGQDIITMNDSSITINRNGASQVVLTDSNATVSSNGHQIVISASGIAMS